MGEDRCLNLLQASRRTPVLTALDQAWLGDEVLLPEARLAIGGRRVSVMWSLVTRQLNVALCHCSGLCNERKVSGRGVCSGCGVTRRRR